MLLLWCVLRCAWCCGCSQPDQQSQRGCRWERMLLCIHAWLCLSGKSTLMALRGTRAWGTRPGKAGFHGQLIEWGPACHSASGGIWCCANCVLFASFFRQHATRTLPLHCLLQAGWVAEAHQIVRSDACSCEGMSKELARAKFGIEQSSMLISFACALGVSATLSDTASEIASGLNR